MRGFFRYYKWHLIFFVIIAICTVYVLFNLTTSNTPDLSLGYAGTQFVQRQDFVDYSSRIELLLRDANGDEKKRASLNLHVCDYPEDVAEALLEMVEDGQYDIYLSTKDAFKNFKDKSRFESVDTYATIKEKDIDVIKDKSGRGYAVSLKDNKLIEYMGFYDTSDLYIAVAAPEKGEAATTTQKNGRNVAGVIIEDDQ